MPITDLAEAKDLDAAIQTLLDTPTGQREQRLRAIFVEKLDFIAATGAVQLPGAKVKAGGAAKPASAITRIAQSDGVHVLWTRLDDRRITTGNARAILKSLEGVLAGDHLLVLSNADDALWHIIWPSQTDGRTIVRRMVVERGLPRRTVVQQLLAMYKARATKEPPPMRDAVASAFDVEAVTHKFFTEYQRLFGDVEAEFLRQSKSQRWAHDYALQLLNRVMFLYFLDRKGWLEPEFLGAFWQAYKGSGRKKDSFFSEWLSVLFFEAFTNTFSHPSYMPKDVEAKLANAPYLNGGLYARGPLDDEFGAKVDDAMWQRIAKFFDSYNFTIAESTPWDQEVAVDPEMIGKVYESLVNVSDVDERGEAGIFYTPRTEIDLMCRLTVVDFLANHLGADHKPALYELVFAIEPEDKAPADRAIADADLWPEVARLLSSITAVDPACGSGSFLVGMLHVLDDLLTRADAVLGKQRTAAERKREIVGRSLYGVDVMDWAVHVAELRLWLQLVIDTDIPAAERKLKPLLPNLSFNVRSGDALVQNVGGVEMSHARERATLPAPIKGDITRLKGEKQNYYAGKPGHAKKEQIERHELELFRKIVDTRIDNLRAKLTGAQGRLRDARVPQGTLGGIEPAATNKKDTAALQIERQIETLNDDLAHAADARKALVSGKDVPFVWDIAFVEVFSGERNGFDVVVGNPPYVMYKKIKDPANTIDAATYKRNVRSALYQSFPDFFGYRLVTGTAAKTIDGMSDLYVYFYFRALSLLAPNGAFAFITSSFWLDVDYGGVLQEFLLRETELRAVIDNEAQRSFSSADINTVIVVASNPGAESRSAPLSHCARFLTLTGQFDAFMNAGFWAGLPKTKSRLTAPTHRIVSVPQVDVLRTGSGLKAGDSTPPALMSYLGDKWGGPLSAGSRYLPGVGRNCGRSPRHARRHRRRDHRHKG